MDDFSVIVIRLFLTPIFYCLPLFVYKLIEDNKPISKKKAWLISILYVLIVWIIHFVLAAAFYMNVYSPEFQPIIDPLSIRSVLFWILINRWILGRGAKETDENNEKKEFKQSELTNTAKDYRVEVHPDDTTVKSSDSAKPNISKEKSNSAYEDSPSFSDAQSQLAEGIEKIYGKESAIILVNYLGKPKIKDVIWMWTSYYVLFDHLISPFLLDQKVLSSFIDSLGKKANDSIPENEYRARARLLINDLVTSNNRFFDLAHCSPDETLNNDLMLRAYANFTAIPNLEGNDKYLSEYVLAAKRIYNILSQIFG